MQVVRPPDTAEPYKQFQGVSLYLVGAGIWQPRSSWHDEILQLIGQALPFEDWPVTVFKPQWSFSTDPLSETMYAKQHLQWEFDHMRSANALLFWFPKHSLSRDGIVGDANELTYQLGMWSMLRKKLFVGIHPEHTRRAEIFDRIQITRPAFIIRDTLTDLAADVKEWATSEIVEHHEVSMSISARANITR